MLRATDSSTITAVAVRSRALVILAGLPGAGKTTLLGRLDAAEPVTVLDSDQVREWIQSRVSLPYRSYRLVVHLVHRFRVFWHALFSPGLLVVHEPSTRPGTRAMLLVIGLLSARPRHFLWLDASAAEALNGQISRHRIIRTHSFERHVRRADVMRDRFEAGWKPLGWGAVTVLTRSGTTGGLCLRLAS